MIPALRFLVTVFLLLPGGIPAYAVEGAALELNAPDRQRWLRALADTCLVTGRDELAQGYYEKIALMITVPVI